MQIIIAEAAASKMEISSAEKVPRVASKVTPLMELVL